MTRVFIIHGWDGNSREERYQKLRSQLGKFKLYSAHLTQ